MKLTFIVFADFTDNILNLGSMLGLKIIRKCFIGFQFLNVVRIIRIIFKNIMLLLTIILKTLF